MPTHPRVVKNAPARVEYQKIRKLSKAHDPEQYTKNPHEHGDVLISGGKLGGTLQRDLLYWIERYTWGINVSRREGVIERPEYAKMSITQLARKCKVWDEQKQCLRPVERKSVAIALADMERRGIIAAKDRKGCGNTTAKMYKATPENWEKAKPYSPPTAKEEAEAEAAIEAEEENPEPAGADPEPDPATVPNGKVSKPTPVTFRPMGGKDPVTIRLVYNPSGFDFPVDFRARTGANGRLTVSATPHEVPQVPHHKHSEKKANELWLCTTIVGKSDAENKRFTDFDTIANEISLSVWKIALTNEKVRLIVDAAGEAPAELFARIAWVKLRGPEAARNHQPGLLIALAKEAAATHAKEKAIQARREADAPAARTPTRITREEQEAAAAAQEERREERERAKLKCSGCNGAGIRESGIKGVFRNCGLCRGSGKKTE